MFLPGQDPRPQPAVRGPVRPERVLEGAAVHPVAEVLAYAMMLPGLPGDGEGERRHPVRDRLSPCWDKNRKERRLYTRNEARAGASEEKRGKQTVLTGKEPPRRVKKGSEWPLKPVICVAPLFSHWGHRLLCSGSPRSRRQRPGVLSPVQRSLHTSRCFCHSDAPGRWTALDHLHSSITFITHVSVLHSSPMHSIGQVLCSLYSKFKTETEMHRQLLTAAMPYCPGSFKCW